MTREEAFYNELKWPVITGLIIGVLVIALVIITGQTFGQRCAEKYEVDSPEWCDCVDSLATGRK